MGKLQKNIDQLVANKVLKDIDGIVQAENKKEKNEVSLAKIVGGCLLAILIFLLVANIS